MTTTEHIAASATTASDRSVIAWCTYYAAKLARDVLTNVVGVAVHELKDPVACGVIVGHAYRHALSTYDAAQDAAKVRRSADASFITERP